MHTYSYIKHLFVITFLLIPSFTDSLSANPQESFDPDRQYARQRTIRGHNFNVDPTANPDLRGLEDQVFILTPIGKEAFLLQHANDDGARNAMQINADKFGEIFHAEPAITTTDRSLADLLMVDGKSRQRKILALSVVEEASTEPTGSSGRRPSDAEQITTEGQILTFDIQRLMDDPPCGTRLAAFLWNRWDVYRKMTNNAVRRCSPKALLHSQLDYYTYACQPRTHWITEGISTSLVVQATSYTIPWVAAFVLPEYTAVTWALKAIRWLPTIHATTSGVRAFFTLNKEEQYREGCTTLTYLGGALVKGGINLVKSFIG